MCCPNCEADSQETWIVEDETNIEAYDDNKGQINITRGCLCNKCRHIWYEHYTGVITDFYWTND